MFLTRWGWYCQLHPFLKKANQNSVTLTHPLVTSTLYYCNTSCMKLHLKTNFNLGQRAAVEVWTGEDRLVAMSTTKTKLLRGSIKELALTLKTLNSLSPKYLNECLHDYVLSHAAKFWAGSVSETYSITGVLAGSLPYTCRTIPQQVHQASLLQAF